MYETPFCPAERHPADLDQRHRGAVGAKSSCWQTKVHLKPQPELLHVLYECEGTAKQHLGKVALWYPVSILGKRHLVMSDAWIDTRYSAWSKGETNH